MRSTASPASSTVKPGRRPDGLGVLLQQPVGDGVERAAPHASGRRGIGVTGGAGDEFVRGASAEGEQQESSGIGAFLDQMGEAGGERGGFAGAGPGDDQERGPVVLDGNPLRLVKDEHAFGG